MLHRRKKGLTGFTLVELAIVLGITGLLFTGLWRLLSNGNQQLRDQATASQQQQLISAISIYLATTDGQNWMGQITAGTSANLPLPGVPAAPGTGAGTCTAWYNTNYPPPSGPTSLLADLCTILPPGFVGPTGANPTVNPYGQNYNIYVLKDNTPSPTPPQAYSFMIVTSGGDVIPDTDGGRISSMIGGDGGFLYTNNTCTPPGNSSQVACGAYGAWLSPITTYGFPILGPNSLAISGHVASRTYYSPTQSSTTPWLARVQMPGDTVNYGFNTMSTDMYTGGPGGIPVNINLSPYTNPAAASGGNINMGGILYGTAGGAETPNATGGGQINMANGSINMAATGWTNAAAAATGALNMNGGTINMSDPTNPTTGGGEIKLQGGEILGVGTNTMISLAGTGKANSLITVANGGCTITQFAPGTGLPEAADGSFCNYSVSTDTLTALNLINASTLYAGTFIYQNSDLRLKTNIRAIKNSLSDVMKLNPVDFRFKASGKEGLGVIAQDIEKIYPQLVVTGPQGMKAVNYDGLIAPLIGAVQELKEENDQLRLEIQTQKVREENLEKELRRHSGE